MTDSNEDTYRLASLALGRIAEAVGIEPGDVGGTLINPADIADAVIARITTKAIPEMPPKADMKNLCSGFYRYDWDGHQSIVFIDMGNEEDEPRVWWMAKPDSKPLDVGQYFGPIPMPPLPASPQTKTPPEGWTKGERCQVCNLLYSTVWHAPDYLWQKISSKGEGGLMCPSCFDAAALAVGINLTWSCELESTDRLLENIGPWYSSMCKCRECGHMQISCYQEGTDPTTLECSRCGQMSCQIHYYDEGGDECTTNPNP